MYNTLEVLVLVYINPIDSSTIAAKPAGFLGGDLFQSYLGALRAAGGRYHAATKLHRFPLDQLSSLVASLRENEFEPRIDPALGALLQTKLAQAKTEVSAANKRIEDELGQRGLFLFPFQQDGVRWLTSRKTALLADSMGTGKSAQVLVSAPEQAPLLVVGPAVAKGVWKREAAKWRPSLTVRILAGRGSFSWPKPGELVVTNYDILPSAAELTALGEPPEGLVLVADECHGLKSYKAKRSLLFKEVSKLVVAREGRLWLLSATPLLNKPQELWSVLSAGHMEKEVFGNWQRFIDLFNGTKGKWGGYEFHGASAEVPGLLKRAMLRREKKDVLPDLPTKMYQDEEVELTKKDTAECDRILAEMKAKGIDWENAVQIALGAQQVAGTTASGSVPFQMLSLARAALATAKIPHLLAKIEDFEEQEEPVVVFSAYRAPIDILKGREGWAVITGDTPPEKRTEIEDAFQKGKLKGVGCTIKAGGIAITLTRASQALFCDLEWTPALNEQAEDRICRIGQTRGCVVTNLVATHPLDQRVRELLGQKQTLISASVEAGRRVAGEKISDQAKDLEATLRSLATPLPAKAAPKTPLKAAADGFTLIQGDRSARRGPKSAEERWAHTALSILSGDGKKIASRFQSEHMELGVGLAVQLSLGLTEGQWTAAISLCLHYSAVVGACPNEF